MWKQFIYETDAQCPSVSVGIFSCKHDNSMIPHSVHSLSLLLVRTFTETQQLKHTTDNKWNQFIQFGIF